MPSLGLLSSLSNSVSALSSYVKDGLKLYMPHSSPKEVKFVGQGSTSFDGINDYIDCGSDSSLDVGASDFTACSWFKIEDDNSHNDIIGKCTSSLTTNTQGWSVAFFDDDKKIYFEAGDASGKDSVKSSAISYDRWYHVAVTRNNSANIMRIYIDGVLEDEETNHDEDVLDDASKSFKIGGFDSPRWFNGNIKNVGFWNRVLSSTEIQNVMYKSYSDLSGTLKQGLNGWWALEGDYLDSTSNDNDGTNNGSTPNTSLYGGATPLIPRGVDNAPTVQADAIGTGYANFDDDEEYIDFGNVCNLGTSDFSIAMWVYSDEYDADEGASAQDTYFISKYQDGNNYWWIRTGSSSRVTIKAQVSGGGAEINEVNGATSLTNGRWHHIVISADVSANIKFYLDGVLTSTDTSYTSSTDLDNTGSLRLGSYQADANYGFLGRLKNVSIWNATLSQEKVQSIMEKTYSELTSNEKTNLVSWWGLDSINTNDGTTTNLRQVVSDEHDTTLTAITIPAFEDVSSASTPTIDGNTITFPKVGVSQVRTTSNVTAGAYKVNITVSNFDGSGTISCVWDGNGGSPARVDANGTYTFYVMYPTDTRYWFYTADGTGGTVVINSWEKFDGNYGVLL